MKKNHPSDGILVFDRYYGKKPIPALLAVGRVLFCALFSAAAMLYIFSQYELSVPQLNVGLYAGITAALFSALFIFVKKRYALPALFLVAGALIWLNFEGFWERFSYFVDEAMLLVEGRFLFPRPYLLHDANRLSPFNPVYADGMLLGAFILCALYSLLCAAVMSRRIRTIPAVLGFILLCVPMLLSERLEINHWFIPFALMTAAAVSIEINYRDGLAVLRGGGASYRLQIRNEEKSFLRKTEGASFLKRVGMRLSYYSKYATTGFYCAAIFALVFCIGFNVFEEGSSIDYRELYKMVTSFGESPDDMGDESSESLVSDYFTGADDKDGRLNIASPGSGDAEILRVTFTGDENIYLRGDIGVDFIDNSWTSPVSDNYEWNRSQLSSTYRAGELLILDALMQSIGADAATEIDISIEYLTETDVVFLPAYTADHSFYSNESFDIYGDYVVRVGDTAENYINSVQCRAVMPDDFTADKIFDILKMMDDNGFEPDNYYSALFPEMDRYEGVLAEYNKYVREHYTSVPDDLRPKLEEFLISSGILRQTSDDGYVPVTPLTQEEWMSQYSDFITAQAICDHLTENYTYSLSGENRGEDMIMQFLTETKRGHCSLYASAMTLLLRTEGIPARYCTGFSIYPDSVSGKTTVLREKNLHAWVEVYIDDLGWVTFDPTSAAVSSINGAGNTQQRPDRNETIQARPETIEYPDYDETREPSSQPNPSEPPAEPDSTVPTGLIVAIVAAVVAIAVIALAVIAWLRLTKRAEAAVASADEREPKSVYACMVDILALCDLRPAQGQLPVDFYRTCDERFGTALESVSGILEAAAFGSGAMNDSDREALCRAFECVFGSAIKHSGAFRRLRIRRLVLKELG
ncbi:MAG: hypothetical protein IJZ47_09270 [Oscillospiraceae bacterium]|nr:hypothetical protein [Oscillospiraceae bacterium]